MEVGGYDLIFTAHGMRGASGREHLAHILIDLCRKHWPTCVIEFDPEPGHFYVYENMAAAAKVEECTLEVSPLRMIYFIVPPSKKPESGGAPSIRFTAVVDHPDHGPSREIVANLRQVFDQQQHTEAPPPCTSA